MPKRTDYVSYACIIGDTNCSLTHKCKDCLKEIKDLNEIDEMFAKVFRDSVIKNALQNRGGKR